MDFITFNNSIGPINVSKSLPSDITFVTTSSILNTSGFIVNIFIMVHSIKNHRAQNNTSHLVRNLLLSNILSSFSWIVGSINMIIAKQAGWPFTFMHFTCKFCIFFWLISYTSNVGTLTLLSIERHIAILHPIRPRLQGPKLNIVLVIVWVLSIVISIPVSFIATVDRVLKFDCSIRIESSPSFFFFYIIFLDIVDYLLPTCIMIYCYTRAIIKLRQTSIIAIRNKNDLSAGERRKKQVTKKLICLTVCFILTALPWLFSFNLIFVQNNLSSSPQQNNNLHLENFIIISPVLFFISLFFDPIFYILNNRNDGNSIGDNVRLTTRPIRKIRYDKPSSVSPSVSLISVKG